MQHTIIEAKFLNTTQERKYLGELKKEENFKISQVDKHFQDCGMGTNYTKTQKLLFYENNLNPENRFKGLFESSDVYLLRWANFLCKSDETFNEFINRFYDKNNFTYSVFKFRDYLIANRQIDELQIAQSMNDAIAIGDYKTLCNIVQNLFLDSITLPQLAYLYKAIAKGFTTIDIVQAHVRKPSAMFVVCMKNLYS